MSSNDVSEVFTYATPLQCKVRRHVTIEVFTQSYRLRPGQIDSLRDDFLRTMYENFPGVRFDGSIVVERHPRGIEASEVLYDAEDPVLT